ncbi:hypothetical protein [Wolbachia endosymbiont (group B) of Villa cingulata]|uniref:hypothetical protein n=1 Tax=Wolbachia endosymbiont (group B) of Villa cingulata TaxID=3066157 RepID=UPI003340A2E8
MPQFKNIENRKNITYKLACNEGKLTSKDKKILNLAKKIEKDANVVKELKKLDKIEEILMVEIVRRCEGRRERLTLLQQALLYSQNATLGYVIKRAEEYKLFEKISGKRIVSEHLGDHGELINTAYSTVVCENGVVQRKTLTCDRQEDIREAVDDYRNNFDFKEQKVTETGTQSHKDINEDKEDFQLTFEKKEKAETEVLLPKEKMVSTQRLISLDPVLLNDEYIGNVNLTMIEHAEEKAMSTRRLIKVDRSLLDNEDNKDFQLTFGNSKKAQNSSIETPNATDSSSLVVCFDGDATDKKDNPSTKTTQQRQVILAGFVGTALFVSSAALYILEMHVIVVVGGIVGLVCIGFALHNSFKLNTKLEKV